LDADSKRQPAGVGTADGRQNFLDFRKLGEEEGNTEE
jgi:hypothetical protein